MSRIGKKPIDVPAGVSIDIKQEQGVITVKGPKGTLSRTFNPDIMVKLEEGKIVLERPTEQKRHKALHGLYRALINNMVTGVTTGYKAQLELVGVGFKAANNGNWLELSLGYSHSIYFLVPDELKVATETQKGKNPTITLEGIDKELLGYIASKIKSLRKVEPYKGKGIRFVDEVVRRKAGKSAGK